MGIKQAFKRLFRRKSAKDEALQSAATALQSDLKRSNQRFKALESAPELADNSKKVADDDQKYDGKYLDELVSKYPKLSRPVELQKESLQLGVAAGYTGKSLREIESSLARIESQMTSRDWFLSNFEDRTPEVIELLSGIKNAIEKHDSIALKRFESIESALNRMSSAAKIAPEPIKKELMKEIESIKSSLPLTPKMEQLITAVKEVGKISYDDLAAKLDVTRSSLRGLLANTMKRSNEIDRYSVGGKGWVRYKYPKLLKLLIFHKLFSIKRLKYIKIALNRSKSL